jgi:hypothetical protein
MSDIQGKLAGVFQSLSDNATTLQVTVVTTLDAIRKALPSPDSVTFNGCEKVTELKDESKIPNDIETGFGGSMQTCRVVTGDLEMGLRLSVYGNNSATAFNSDIDANMYFSDDKWHFVCGPSGPINDSSLEGDEILLEEE